MLLGFQHAGDGELGELRRWVVDALDFEADAIERAAQFIDARARIEMIFEPGQREFH